MVTSLPHQHTVFSLDKWQPPSLVDKQHPSLNGRHPPLLEVWCYPSLIDEVTSLQWRTAPFLGEQLSSAPSLDEWHPLLKNGSPIQWTVSSLSQWMVSSLLIDKQCLQNGIPGLMVSSLPALKSSSLPWRMAPSLNEQLLDEWLPPLMKIILPPSTNSIPPSLDSASVPLWWMASSLPFWRTAPSHPWRMAPSLEEQLPAL